MIQYETRIMINFIFCPCVSDCFASVNNNLTQLKKNFHSPRQLLITGVVMLILSFCLVGFYFYAPSDPYLQQVLSLQGDRNRGEAIFTINCAGCHGLKGMGDIGPSLEDISKRRSKVALIDQVIGGKTPPMPKFQPDAQTMADLLNYLEKF